MEYYDWQAVRSLLGLQQWPYQAPPMVYMDDLNRPRNHQQQGSGDFFTEPWMAWGEEKLGVNTPTPGERTDASIDRLREGKGGVSDVAGTVPSTAYQWFDPF